MTGWQATVAALCIVTGTVFDAQHHPIPSAKVVLQSSTGKREVSALADSAGVFRFSVASGNYTLRAEGDSVIITAQPNKTTIANLQAQPGFDDQPQYTPAGVTDYTYRGGHGSDNVFRSSEAIAKELKDERTPVGGDLRENEIYEAGTDLLNRHSSQAAAEIFLKGTRLFPQSVRMLLGMASALYAQGAYDEAAQWFFRATDLVPTNSKPYLYLGQVKAKQITQAKGYQERMARFAKLQPDNALANYYYGTTLPDDRAREAFRKALELDPHLAIAHAGLGAIALREGNHADAVRELQEATAADPEMEEAHYRLAEAYRLSGNPAKAKEELAIFQKLSRASGCR